MPQHEGPVTIRRAVQEDRAFVLSLAERFAETRIDWRTEDEVTIGTLRMLRSAFDEPRERDVLLIAEDTTGSPLGFALGIVENDFFTGEPHAHLSELAALPGGTGAGVALIEAIETWARDGGSRYLSLNVTRPNARARAIYERCGFEPEFTHMTKLL